MSWLADYFRRSFIRNGGAAMQDRETLNFIGFTVTDNPATNAIDITPDAATTSAAGSMSAADKAKLDGMQKQGACLNIDALAIDWSLSCSFSKALTAATSHTFTFANATSGWDITVRLTGAGTSTVTWPTVRWVGGAPTQTHDGTDVYSFWHDGTDIFGSVLQDFP